MLEPRLHTAAEQGKLEEVNKLLRHPNIDPNAPDFATGETPLHKACGFGTRLGDNDVVRRQHRQDLLEFGVRRMLGPDKLVPRRAQDNRPRTEAGFSPSVVSEGLRPAQRPQHGESRLGANGGGSSSGHARLAIVAALLQAGADPNARGRFEYTPLHYACWRGHALIVEALLEAGADPELRSGRRTGSHLAAGTAYSAGDTPTDLAARCEISACQAGLFGCL